MKPFDPSGLALDSEALLAKLERWVHCESPSWEPAAVNRMVDLVVHELAQLDASIERLPVPGYGDAIRARLRHASAGEPGILILGHLDTVHPTGTLFWRREGDRCYGPGLLDMKSGNLLAVEALRALQAEQVATSLPVTILFTPDEEVGSPASRALIEARRNRYVLVPEPARADGSLVIGRHSVKRLLLRAEGRPGHAGHAGAGGGSAIRRLADMVGTMESLSTGLAYCRVGVIRGGRLVNCLPVDCEAELLVVAQTHDALSDLLRRIRLSAAEADLLVVDGPERPFWVAQQDNPMLALAREIAEELGFALGAVTAGGGSDGNFTGSLGIPTLDGLGAQGDGLHTLEEHILVSSLAQRARLMAGLLARLK